MCSERSWVCSRVGRAAVSDDRSTFVSGYLWHRQNEFMTFYVRKIHTSLSRSGMKMYLVT